MNAFLHIPKTAGSAIKDAIRSAEMDDDTRPDIYLHESSLLDLRGQSVVFSVRDPVDRVISGFYSRLRMGRPKVHIPHSRAEAKTFRRWPQFEDLARDVLLGKRRARKGWRSIGHLRPLSTWLRDVDELRSARIAYIADIRTLEAEWPHVRDALGLPKDSELPSSPIKAHRAPNPAPEISHELRRDLMEKLWHDYELYEECLSLRRQRGWETSGASSSDRA